MNAFDTVKRSAAAAIERYRMLENVSLAGVAVSGGADSVCLLLVLREFCKVAVVHVNHLLRAEESEADEAFVRSLAARFELPLYVKRVDVRALGGNTEETARGERYEFYRELIASQAVHCVATGHTRSDQSETVLFRVLRGAHLAGLSAIHPIAPGPVIRPLLNVSRTEVEDFVRDAGETWRDDSTNHDLAYDRNRIRHVLLPELAREWNPEIDRALSQLAALAFDEERYWAGWMAEHFREHFKIRGNIVLTSASNLIDQPVAVARRLVRKAIERVRGDLHAVEFAHVEAVIALARSREGSGRMQLPQVDVYRSFDWLRFGPIVGGDHLAERNQQTPCEVPGRASLPGSDVWLNLEVIENKDVSNAASGAVENARVKRYELDWDRVLGLGQQLVLRTWKPGDQYRPVGERLASKVKTMFQESRIPLWERGTWPIITVGTQIVWTRQFGPAAEVVATGDSRRVLRVSEDEGKRESWE
jgi:tRNA(Ile)-lysidine synthase